MPEETAQVLSTTLNHQQSMVKETVKQLGPAYEEKHVTPGVNQPLVVEGGEPSGEETAFQDFVEDAWRNTEKGRVGNSASFLDRLKARMRGQNPGREIVEELKKAA